MKSCLYTWGINIKLRIHPKADRQAKLVVLGIFTFKRIFIPLLYRSLRNASTVDGRRSACSATACTYTSASIPLSSCLFYSYNNNVIISYILNIQSSIDSFLPIYPIIWITLSAFLSSFRFHRNPKAKAYAYRQSTHIYIHLFIYLFSILFIYLFIKRCHCKHMHL